MTHTTPPTDHLDPRWQTALEAYRAHLDDAGRKPQTWQTHTAYLRNLARTHHDPWHVTAADLTAWESSAGYRTTRALRAAVRSFYAWAHRTGQTATNPALEAFPADRLAGVRAHARNADRLAYELPPRWAGHVDTYAVFLAAAGRRPGTIRQHRAHLGMLAAIHPDPTTITERDLLAYLAGKDWAPETRKAARSVLRSFFAWAAGRGGLLDVDPAAELPSVRVPAGVPHPTPTDVLEAALERADDKGRLMLLLGAYAGLRRAEIAAVHPARDVTDGALRVVGKGGRARLVPLHPRVAAAIDDELARRRQGTPGTGFRYAAAATADGYLFPGVGPGTHVQPGAVGKTLADLLGEHWTAHGLRHRFATRAYAGTRDLRAVQTLLGHSQPETTARYTAVPDGALTAAVLAV
ncbi:hypothetical protein GCM10027418_19140 [Mariniluteicoccus endophyticus]